MDWDTHTLPTIGRGQWHYRSIIYLPYGGRGFFYVLPPHHTVLCPVQINYPDLDRVPLFKNTMGAERMKFLGSCGGACPISVKAGDGISKARDVRDKAFLVEIVLDEQPAEVTLSSNNPGFKR